MQGDREKCIAAGMNDSLSKPFKAQQLRDVLERWSRLSPPAGPALEAVTTARHENAIDRTVFDDFREPGADGGANDFVTKLIDQYLADSLSRMAELKDTMERRDAPAVRLASHSLKGTSSTVGANRMASICEEVEQLARNATFDRTLALVAELEGEFTRVRQALQLEQGTAALVVPSSGISATGFRRSARDEPRRNRRRK
jgi:two-component system sensor histidine kinase/response regulator